MTVGMPACVDNLGTLTLFGHVLSWVEIKRRAFSGPAPHLSRERLMGTATTTGMLLAKLRELLLNKGIHGFPNVGGIAAEIDGDPDLIETHQRAKSHAAGNEGLCALIGQILYGCHASPLFMRNIRDDVDGLDGLIFQGDQGVEVAMSEMGAQHGVQSAGMRRWDGYDGAH